MKKYCILSALFVLCACNSVTPAGVAVDNSAEKMEQFNSCDSVIAELDKTNLSLDAMQEQKRLVNQSNALNAAAGLISLNPLSVFDATRTGELDKTITTYQERQKLLEEKMAQLSCNDKEHNIHNENQTVLGE